jgi:hypothetical protein
MQRKGIEMFRSFGWFGIGSIVMALAFIASAENPYECYPACRSGFECHNGNCVSKCNPPCPNGQNCTDSGDCVPLTRPETAAGKQPIHCAAVYVVRPHMDSTNVPGNFQESEFLNASNLIAVEVTKKVDSRSRVISSEDIDAIQSCNVEMIVMKVVIYYKKPAPMGQFVGVLTISISNYDSPRQKTPVSTQEFTAEGDRHWGDSVPLENAIDAMCKKISRKYKP